MLSVLIPVYNYDLRALVEALVMQMEALKVDAEIIIRDDGSDQWEQRNSKLASIEQVRYHSNPANIGRSATRQALAKEAKWDQLLFLDADVLPVDEDFLSTYLEHPDIKNKIACGGVQYQEEPPAYDKMLRYVFGKQRESQPAGIRQKNPHMVLSANLWIQRERFMALNDQLDNFYGDDLVLSEKIRRQNLDVLHLDNPVYHLGLESSKGFMAKTGQMIQNLVRLEEEGVIGPDLMRLQRAYLNLKAKGLIKPYLWATKQLLGGMRRNLLGKNPSIKTFDAYKLHLYAKLKSNG